MNVAQVKRALEPSPAFYEELLGEVQAYERLKRREFDELHTLADLGRLLIAARIASGLCQRELADRLGVHESQVSRDERTNYAGVTVDRAHRILDALGVQTTTRAQLAGPVARSAVSGGVQRARCAVRGAGGDEVKDSRRKLRLAQRQKQKRNLAPYFASVSSISQSNECPAA